MIEAHYLFGADYDDIDIVVHPQSIIHSAVETSDSSVISARSRRDLAARSRCNLGEISAISSQVIAQLGWPDMRLPILYSMSWPHRVNVDYGRGIDDKFDLIKLGSMSFKVWAHVHTSIMNGLMRQVAESTPRRLTPTS